MSFKHIKDAIGVISGLIGIAQFLWNPSRTIFTKIFGSVSGGALINFMVNNCVGLLAVCILLIVYIPQIKVCFSKGKEKLKLKDKYSETYPYTPDFPAWDAIQFILNDTVFGSKKDKNDFASISWTITEVIRLGYINIWVKKSIDSNSDFIALDIRQLKDSWLEIQPSDPVGKIRSDDYTYWYLPTFSKKEIKEFFTNEIKKHENIT